MQHPGPGLVNGTQFRCRGRLGCNPVAPPPGALRKIGQRIHRGAGAAEPRQQLAEGNWPDIFAADEPQAGECFPVVHAPQCPPDADAIVTIVSQPCPITRRATARGFISMLKFTASAVLALALSTTAATALPFSLSFIGEQIVPTGTQFDGTTIGGLSGIDHISGERFVAISDDRAQINFARFYDVRLDYNRNNFNGVTFTDVTELRAPGNNPYPPISIDPEAIRRLPGGGFLITSEGDVNASVDAFFHEIRGNGRFERDIALPAGFQQTGPAGTTGIRNNLAFESLALSADGLTAHIATENALRQDGPAAAFGTPSVSRIIRYDVTTGAATAQFAYEVEPVSDQPIPANSFATNGLVELLDIGGGQLLSVERSFSNGVGNSIKLFVIDTNGATDISGLGSLVGETYTAVSKELLLDLGTLGITLDNIEGVSFGKTFGNGNRSLILVSDNNFSSAQFTQFLAFEIIETPAPAAFALFGLGIVGLAVVRRR